MGVSSADRRCGRVDRVAGPEQDVVQRGEREPLHGACLLGREIVQHREHALLDGLAHGLAREHADDALDRHIRLLGDLDQN